MSEGGITTEIPRKRCAYCNSLMDVSASVCPICRYHQSRIRNVILLCAAATGLASLVVSSLAFSMPKVYYLLFWSDKLNVQYFHTFTNGHYDLMLSNSGSGTVLVGEITVNYGDANNYPFYVGKSVSSGEFLTTPVLDTSSELRSFEGGYVSNSDGNQTAPMKANSTVDWSVGGNKCYALFFINSEAEDIRRMNRAYATVQRRLVTESVDAKIVYFDAKSGKRFDQPFPAVATYVLSSEPRCKLGG